SVPGDGSGQLVAIIDAGDQPNLRSDLAVFSTTFGLPQMSDQDLIIVDQYGGHTLPAPATGGDGLETTLDVEWVHALAPKAKILLVEAKNLSWPNLLTAINTARQWAGVSTISMSFGGPELPTDRINNQRFF